MERRLKLPPLLIKQTPEQIKFVDEAKEQAVEEAKKIKLSAEADIEQSANKAKDGLRDEVAALVIAGAQKILDKEINAKANKDIIDSLIKKI